MNALDLAKDRDATLVEGEDEAQDGRGSSFGWGVALVLAGCALFAKEMGWVHPRFNWVLPAVLIGIGSGFIVQTLQRGRGTR